MMTKLSADESKQVSELKDSIVHNAQQRQVVLTERKKYTDKFKKILGGLDESDAAALKSIEEITGEKPPLVELMMGDDEESDQGVG